MEPPVVGLPIEFFQQDTRTVARSLLGMSLVSTIDGQCTGGVIVETEAYLPSRDRACHAYHHRTPRTEVMFGVSGVAYVYPIHARYCFNVVTEGVGSGAAVLVRALQPSWGLEAMQYRRKLVDPRRLTTGPACLCQSLAIDRSFNGHPVWSDGPVRVMAGSDPPLTENRIAVSTRIGVTAGKHLQLRYYLAGNRFVSGPASMRT